MNIKLKSQSQFLKDNWYEFMKAYDNLNLFSIEVNQQYWTSVLSYMPYQAHSSKLIF